MSRIFKSVSLKETPVIIITPDYGELEHPESDIDCDQADPEAEAESLHSGHIAAMLEQAREQAAAVVAEAAEQAAAIKQNAYDEAYRQGHQEGFSQGEEAGLNQVRQAIDNAVKRAEDILALTDKQAVQMLEAAERQIVELALTIAGKVLSREIAENDSVVLPVLKTALEKVRDQERISIRVCQQDYELTLQVKAELQAWLNRDSVLTIVPDESLKKGDCIIETPYGMVDARMDNQFALVKSALRDMLP